MNLHDPALLGSDAAIIDQVLRGLVRPTTFDELSRNGTWHVASRPGPQLGGGSFPTPTGRVEIASQRAELNGHELTARPVVATSGGRGTFQLVTPTSFWRINSSFSEMAKVEELEGPPSALIAREDARQLGITDGQLCEVLNDVGTVRLITRISDIPLPGTIVVFKCRGEGSDPAGIEINRLVPAHASDMGGCVAFHGIRVDVHPLPPASN